MSVPVILIIGASGRTGVQIIREAAKAEPKPAVHAFARSPDKISAEDAALCASVVQGDARRSEDIERALTATNANFVVMSVGVPNSLARSDLREMTARALMDVIHPGSKFEHVKVLVVSSVGAGGTKIDIGMGAGYLLSFVIRHLLRDHDNQEKEFTNRMAESDSTEKRLLIVRPTGLTYGKATGKTAVFGTKERAPSTHIDRADLAKWIVDEIGSGGLSFGKDICITGMR